MKTKINDLRSALDYLRTIPGQLVETDVEAQTRWPRSPAFTATSAPKAPSNARPAWDLP